MPVCVVGIAGGSGSGKSWLATYLKRRLGRKAVVMSLDWYYQDKGHVTGEAARRLNFDHPSAIDMPLLIRHMDRLIAGETVKAPRYHYASHARLPQTHTVRPARVIVVEGLHVLHDARLRQRLHVSVFIDFPADLRLIRRIRRDVEHRRIDLEETLRLYEHCVHPMHDRFIAPSSRKATWLWKQEQDKAFPQKLLAKLRARLAKAGEVAAYLPD